MALTPGSRLGVCGGLAPLGAFGRRAALMAVLLAGGPALWAQEWTVPRTAWGDPDLQGVFTNSNEYATPLERPEAFAGRALQDVIDQELEEIQRTAERVMVARLPGGRVRGPDDWWLQNLDLRRRSQPWLIVDPSDGTIPTVTPEGEARNRRAGRVRSSFVGGPFDGPEDLGLLERCITRSVPGAMLPVMYSNTYQIVQTPGFVALVYEILHETRVVPIVQPGDDLSGGRLHGGEAIRQDMGDARGYWEGDTLVVETTSFTSESAFRRSDPATLRVTERFTRVAPDTIAWEATIDDPATWTRPWTIAMPLRRDTYPLLPFDCHEHNHGLRNILSAARASAFP